jgi:hypothetical protein
LLDSRLPVDALPPSPSTATESYVYAPGDIYPRGDRERQLCATASSPDWLYLAGLLAVDVGAIWFGSTDLVKGVTDGTPFTRSEALRFTGPALIGIAWGATLGGTWLALPKCSPHWVDTPPREGDVRAAWPLAISIALLAGATAPIVNGIAVGDLPQAWTTEERVWHLVVAGLAGFGGALLPYVLPPRTWVAARELEHIRLGLDAHGGPFVQYGFRF